MGVAGKTFREAIHDAVASGALAPPYDRRARRPAPRRLRVPAAAWRPGAVAQDGVGEGRRGDARRRRRLALRGGLAAVRANEAGGRGGVRVEAPRLPDDAARPDAV